MLLRALDPPIFKKPSNCAEKGAGAQSYTAVAERFDVFDKRVSVPRLNCQAHQDEKNRLCQRFRFLNDRLLPDMSHADILRKSEVARNAILIRTHLATEVTRKGGLAEVSSWILASTTESFTESPRSERL